ncbi:MAG: hypothetical protein ACR2OX_00180, partial [Methyloligellaceae bacterium]
MPTIIIATAVFVVTALVAFFGLQWISQRRWQQLEYGVVVLGLIGVLLALTDAAETKRKQEVDRLTIVAQERLQGVMNRMEYIM